MTRTSRRILITGARGFVGRHCLELLEQGDANDELHATTSQAVASDDGAVSSAAVSGDAVSGDAVSDTAVRDSVMLDSSSSTHWHQVDLLDAAEARALIRRIRPTHLLHLAWFTQPGAFWHSPENARWAEASRTLLDEFIAAGGRRVVMTGSCAEYDWSNGVCDERSTPLRPSTPYGVSKVELFRDAEAACRAAGVSFSWARLFFMYGPGAPLEKFPGVVLRSLAENQPALCTDGRQLRDFLFVRDAADALVRLLASVITGPINVASGEGLALADIARTVARLMDKEHLLRLGALPMRPGDPPTIVADVARLRDELHWRPATSLETGILQCLPSLVT